MTDLYAIKNDIEQLRCSTHQERPIVKVFGDKLNVTTCCDEFSKLIDEKIDESMLKGIDKSIDDVFKKAFG